MTAPEIMFTPTEIRYKPIGLETTKVAIVEKALDIIGGSRAVTHGDALENHQKIADVWNGILKAAGVETSKPLDALMVANLMEGLKIARRFLGAYNVDDYIDGVGYAAVAGEIASRMEQKRIDKSWSDAAMEGGSVLIK